VQLTPYSEVNCTLTERQGSIVRFPTPMSRTQPLLPGPRPVYSETAPGSRGTSTARLNSATRVPSCL
jgi:hypothetical protein